MIKCTIIAVGRLDEEYWRDAAAEYEKRLDPYCKLTIVEVPDVPFKNKHDKEKVLKEEAEKIAREIPEGSYVVALDQRGQQYTSKEWAEHITQWSEFATPITFIIGGPLGLDDMVQEQVNTRLALSIMTFPHQLARVLLLEQLYRAQTILAGKTYHY